jgi:hypothetical protein
MIAVFPSTGGSKTADIEELALVSVVYLRPNLQNKPNRRFRPKCNRAVSGTIPHRIPRMHHQGAIISTRGDTNRNSC